VIRGRGVDEGLNLARTKQICNFYFFDDKYCGFAEHLVGVVNQ
jgi:hypothetical protein